MTFRQEPRADESISIPRSGQYRSKFLSNLVKIPHDVHRFVRSSFHFAAPESERPGWGVARLRDPRLDSIKQVLLYFVPHSQRRRRPVVFSRSFVGLHFRCTSYYSLHFSTF